MPFVSERVRGGTSTPNPGAARRSRAHG